MPVTLNASNMASANAVICDFGSDQKVANRANRSAGTLGNLTDRTGVP
jgi:hypothetical protein